ncbi:MAG: 3-phosphoshikimate 1-carboxyvinyltransferase [Spirochaetales bacterium]|nr:MAG: 3-phosphoshikimate 1-carboxyvinyltransferase [Spirochaetales bacterium]
MEKVINPSHLEGSVRIPASKSHTIRALLIAALAEGESIVRHPLASEDTASCLRTILALGAGVRQEDKTLVITGTEGSPGTPENVIDTGNSGTTLYLAAGAAALQGSWTVFTGDEQIRRRPIEGLLGGLRDLGAEAFSTRGNGCAPVIIKGPLRGGETSMECPTSQYLTSLLLAAPLAAGDSTIHVPLLYEKPYIDMTLGWLSEQGILLTYSDYSLFRIKGGQRYRPFDKSIPADFSSAAFFLCAAAITGSELTLLGLDMKDTQGDKALVGMLESMGVRYSFGGDSITVLGAGKDGPAFTGADLDLNDTPDALPALAAAACFAEGTTRLFNVPQARLKETDRITVMQQELSKMGADIEEMPDGLIIKGRGGKGLTGARVCGRGDHRVIMALSVAALGAEGKTVIDDASAAGITFPDFYDLLGSVMVKA